MIQFGTEKAINLATENPTADGISKFLQTWKNNNLYFLAGINAEDPKMKTFRASDINILKKNYFYIDLDIRKTNPDLTDEQIKTDIWEKWAKPCLKAMGTPFSDWRYVVFTGNGLHIYYSGRAIDIPDKKLWSAGLNAFLDAIEKSFGEKFDRACCNPARIARMPGSMNCKKQPFKLVEIIDFQDKIVNLSAVLADGEKAILLEQANDKKRMEDIKKQYPDRDEVYAEIDKIPVAKVLCMLTGWSLNSDNKNFSSPGKINDRKGLFVGTDIGNVIINSGSDHLPASSTGYRPFHLVKTFKKYDDFQTFLWFKQNFAHIRKISDAREQGVTVEVSADYNIVSVFQELKALEVRQLEIGGNWDAWRLLLKGKVTRIGAMPGTGKSKLGYFLTHKLLLKERKGLFFSTEVQAPEVLAHLLQIRMKTPYLDILEHRVPVLPEAQEDFRNLKVYDVRHTGNMLSRMETIIKQECDRGEAKDGRGVDFVVVDFSQQVTPKSGRYTDIFTWATEWGNQCQEIAQKYDLCFIDVNQLSIKGNKDEDEKYGHIPYEGGNKLVQTADIASMISRDKSLQSNTQVTWDVRKSKSMGRRFRLEMDYDWNTGEFKLSSAVDSRITPQDPTGTHNYRTEDILPRL